MSNTTKKFALSIVSILIMAGMAQALTKIACIGNSITYGYGLSSPATQSYPPVLQSLLGKTNDTVQNEGVNSTTLQKRGNIPYWTNGKLAQTFSFQPDIVTIMLGTNDTKPPNWDSLGYGSGFKADYLAMVDTLSAMASKPRIYAVLPVPVFSNAQATAWGIRDSVIQKVIPIIRQAASERGLTVIDCNTPLKNFPQYFSVDGVHPNAAGEDTIAHVLYRALTATAVAGKETAPLRPTVPFITVKNNGAISIAVSSGAITTAELFDIRGKRVDVDNSTGVGRLTLGAGNLHSGVYLLRFTTGYPEQSFYRKIEFVR
ncbi:MAG: GDSL-type esterase/lipase family protein [Chitinispirillaceae bacterium]|jgi:lysophospholipase L1-like esterase